MGLGFGEVQDMEGKSLGTRWPKALWKIVKNPTVEIAAAIVAVLLATWVVVQTEIDGRRGPRPFEVPFVHK
jgi:hypothetical protein